ncbi:14116_t:CDS:2 [Acaulospora morrowiae]|uniref:14116_t:CDS:1 n=1 Tax=Acaulospora morrowiae TaxID=94023 RepID=A0A9N9BH28_9GLOM|nr:14116_t:CDS:2 [Acaulospora morrowiae]
MDTVEDWYQTSINEYKLNEIPFDEFSDRKRIGGGGFGTIFKYVWNKSSEPKMVALKGVYVDVEDDNACINNFINEVKLISNANHPRIIKFYGISHDEDEGLYYLVLELADGGNLREHLFKKRMVIQWADRIKFATQITEGISYLHNELKISHQYALVALDIITSDLREKPVIGTPISFMQLYSECWNTHPDRRPTAIQILERLKTISIEKVYDSIEKEVPSNIIESDIFSSSVLLDSNAIIDSQSMTTTSRVVNVTSEINSNLDAGNAVQPLIRDVATVIEETNRIYENVTYNKNICTSLMDRVVAAEFALKTLEIKKKFYEQNFRNGEYYTALVHFVNVMKEISQFMNNLSTLSDFKKLTIDNLVEDRFKRLSSEFENVMNELKFSIPKFDEQEKFDQKGLKSDLEEMSNLLERVEGGARNINEILQEVLIIKEQSFFDKKIKVTQIDLKELFDPLVGKLSDTRGDKQPPLVKKIFRGNEVACKPIMDDDISESQEIQVLSKSKDSPNIIKFYGLSKISGHQVMVFEWAELGTLQEVYNKYDIAWHSKIQIALDICRGLVFLHSCEILHHDIRCANILMTSRLEAKISNFKYVRFDSMQTSNMTKCLTDVVRWMAPEKMRHNNKNPMRYTYKCEIFSFGMLLWELAFEKIPYENMDTVQIMEHVLMGKREKISLGFGSPNIQKLQQAVIKIITTSWQQDANSRITLAEIFLKLDKLSTDYTSSPSLLSEGTINLDGQPPVQFEIPSILSLEEGIEAHKKKDYITAWKCFQDHAYLDSITAKYWMGYYLIEGYPSGVKDLVKASQLFKEAADCGIVDAQLRYAFSLFNTPGVKFDREIFLEYLIKAADNGSDIARYHLGDLYLNGKLGFQKDEELGKKYLKSAALGNHPKAIEVLKNIGIISS